METKALLKYVTVSAKRCHGCTHCMRHCPVEAIRIRNGYAIIDHNKCILCGRCLDDCAYHAISLVSPKALLETNGKVRYLIVQKGFFGHFPTQKHKEVQSALRKLGYHHVVDCRDFKRLGYLWGQMHNSETDNKNISTRCNVIKNLIRKGKVGEENNIRLVPTIAEIITGYIHLFFGKKSKSKTSITITTHCMSENDISHSQHDRIFDADKAVPTYELVNQVQKELWDNKPQSWSVETSEVYSPLHKEFVQISGIDNVLGWIHKNEIKPHDYTRDYHLQGCKDGCYNGSYMSEYSSIIKKRESGYQNKLTDKFDTKTTDRLHQISTYWNEKPDIFIPPKENFKEALIRTERTRKLMCLLPGIDCGVCGAPSCLALAKDISKGIARLSQCVLLDLKWMKNKNVGIDTTMQQIEKIWGDKILQLDCTKKGAQNEIIHNRRDESTDPKK
ncbi:4Fe-4S binding protein [Halosquirtibacter laminarini]|uniref:4Fe-4S binding protein n=1 Tax=Halosquirtibacter laminarini TaxID=3374600 RepID=A0AC61NGM8_9BACT|nr:4Fe-4S binding protein [Prolixibacteraceae bacterium]